MGQCSSNPAEQQGTKQQDTGQQGTEEYCQSDEEYCQSDEEHDLFSYITTLTPAAALSKCSHTVFILDTSASMKMRDVECGDTHISRSSAVFDCCRDFVVEQIHSGAGARDTCTIITFNDEVTRWTGYPNPPTIKKALLKKITSIESSCRVELGTKYLEGLSAALRICGLMAKRADIQSVVFLSDGSPGDLNFGSRNEEHLTEVMGQLQAAVMPGKLHFHSIGFGGNSFVWLQKMAACVNGKFHKHQVCKGGFSFTEIQSTFRSISSELTAMRSSTHSNSIRAIRTPKMQSYGTSVDTQLLTCNVWIFCIDQQKWYRVDKDMSAHVNRTPFAEGASRKAFRVTVCLDGLPDKVVKAFKSLQAEEDGCRGLLLVGKERGSASMASALKFQSGNFRSLLVAKAYLSAFKLALKEVPRLPRGYVQAFRATFLSCILLCSIKNQPCRLLSVEKYLEGEYRKFNSNDGYVNKSYKSGDKKNAPGELMHDIAQAYSHYTWVQSNGQHLVCDIQGVGLAWTDPQVNSLDGDGFGQGDLRGNGIQSFFASHTCNGLCRALKISGRWPS